MQDTEENVFWATVHKMDVESKIRALSNKFFYDGVYPNLALQGELLGPGIQGNKYDLKEHVILWFNLFDINSFKYFHGDDFFELVEEVGLKTVPLINKFILNNTVDELVEMSKDKSKLNDKIHREGIVIRPCEEKEDKKLGRVSFKVINPDFLLKFGE